MGKKDKRVDDYISRSANFAKPILTHIRQLVHSACADVEETIKWGFPNFDYKGVFCSMAAFKEYCSFGFWKAAIMKDAEKPKINQESAMRHLGKIKSINDLPADKILISYIKEAARLNDEGIKLPPRNKSVEKKELIIPEYFTSALSKNKKANQVFQSFSLSHKKEYVEWITEDKTDETRNKRMATALKWRAEGKGRNRKYERLKESSAQGN